MIQQLSYERLWCGLVARVARVLSGHALVHVVHGQRRHLAVVLALSRRARGRYVASHWTRIKRSSETSVSAKLTVAIRVYSNLSLGCLAAVSACNAIHLGGTNQRPVASQDFPNETPPAATSRCKHKHDTFFSLFRPRVSLSISKSVIAPFLLYQKHLSRLYHTISRSGPVCSLVRKLAFLRPATSASGIVTTLPGYARRGLFGQHHSLSGCQ